MIHVCMYTYKRKTKLCPQVIWNIEIGILEPKFRAVPARGGKKCNISKSSLSSLTGGSGFVFERPVNLRNCWKELPGLFGITLA